MFCLFTAAKKLQGEQGTSSSASKWPAKSPTLIRRLSVVYKSCRICQTYDDFVMKDDY